MSYGVLSKETDYVDGFSRLFRYFKMVLDGFKMISGGFRWLWMVWDFLGGWF